MKELLTEWRKYLAEVSRSTNLAGYMKALDNFSRWSSSSEEPYRGMIHKVPEVVESANILIDDDNKKYRGYLKKGVYEKAIAVAGLNASSKAARSAANPIRTKITQLQQDTYDIAGINLPFLDPSVKRDLHPKWKNSPIIGATLQTVADTLLGPEDLLLLLLVILTGGVGTAAYGTKLGSIANRINKLLKIEDAYHATHKALHKFVTEKILKTLFLYRKSPPVVQILSAKLFSDLGQEAIGKVGDLIDRPSLIRDLDKQVSKLEMAFIKE